MKEWGVSNETPRELIKEKTEQKLGLKNHLPRNKEFDCTVARIVNLVVCVFVL